jgi:hypothetical protein
MSGFVIWIMQWIALSGWLLATLGIAPWLLIAGVQFNAPSLSRAAVLVQTPTGVTAVSLVLALCTTVFLTRGLRLYVRIQRWLFIGTLAAVIAVVYIFIRSSSNFAHHLDEFVATLISQLHLAVPSEMKTHFSSYLLTSVRNSGTSLAPPFSFWATLGLVPIVWTSLQWATYSVEQNTEIAEADRFRKQVLILLFSACAVAFVLWLIAHVEHVAATKEFVVAASNAYWAQKGSPELVSLVKSVLQPFPNILAMAVSGSIVLSTLIALGFVANAFQVTCNCFIGVTRILVAMSTDGLLDSKLQLHRVSPLRHAPVRAHWVYLLASIPWIVAYNFVPGWSVYTLGVTFACGYVFAFSALAATKIPSRMASAWKTSEVYRTSPKLIRFIGYLGFCSGIVMVGAYLLVPQLGLTGTVPYSIVFGIAMLAYLLYLRARARSPLVDRALEETPAEVEQFYNE